MFRSGFTRRLMAVLAVGFGSATMTGCGDKADAGQNVEENRLAASKAGVGKSEPTQRTSKPPFDPTK